MKRGVLVIDLDGVLFDAKKFKKPFFMMLQAVTGVDPVVAYEAVKSGAGFYDADRHFFEVTRMAGRGDWMPCFLRASTISLLKNNPDAFLTEGALEFLGRARKMFEEVVLATRGTKWFQMAKIEASGADALISRVFCVQEGKKSDVPLSNGKSLVFVDDSEGEINEFKRACPDAYTVHFGPDMVAPMADVKALGFSGLLKALKALEGEREDE